MSTGTKITKKYFGKYKAPLADLPAPIEMQQNSYKWLLEKGIAEVFKEFAVIHDYSGKKFDLSFVSFKLDAPKYDDIYAKANKLSYETPLRAIVRLTNKVLGQEKDQEIFLTDFPLMTEHGTFVVNGVERIVVPQLARSFGIFFTAADIKGKNYFGAKIIPARGSWIELETDSDDIMYVRVDRRRKIPVSSFLRVLSGKSDADIKKDFTDLPDGLKMLELAFSKDHAKNLEDSYVEMYKRLRDNDLANADSAKEYIETLFGEDRYDLSHVGRYRFNKRFGMDMGAKTMAKRTLNYEDILTTVKHILKLNADPEALPDDIDHLGLRRIRPVGEMFQLKVRLGLAQMKRNTQDRMSTIDTGTVMPVQVVNPRPLQARIKEFFTTNQLSQLAGQENVLSELEHLRRLSALGPGGLTRERAGFEVRDVHTSHYGRVCPIQTPEGPNIGLILTLSSYARINELGIIETPYRKVKAGKITDEVVFLNALEEESYNIAHAAVAYDDKGRFTEEKVEARLKANPGLANRDEVDFIDVAPNQGFSLATSMIPFLEHDNANRSLMGTNMQRQATPCIIPEYPIVATGMEVQIATATGRLVVAKNSGVVEKVDSRKIVVKTDGGDRDEYILVNYSRTNDFTAFHQRPIVNLKQEVKKGQILADTSSTDQGQISLGQNVLVGFMSWGGANYEDAIIISERIVKNSKFASIHVEEFSISVRDTKLGPEVTTHDIPNVGEGKLKDLDEDGIVRIGAEIGPNDILVGKITPKGETELTPEERLLRSIFGEKSRDVKDTSLRMGHGKRGRVIGVKVFSRDKGAKLESGIIKKVYIEVAQLRSVSVGDKLAGRHGNKGIISRILPEEDMPYRADGTSIDVILTPLGVPSRMNLGQIFEMHMGLTASIGGYQAINPGFLGATSDEIKAELVASGLPESGKVTLYDGLTGEKFEQDIAIGYMYILKLHHMVEDKIHMRSIGPYSLITQQPLGGKAQGGGQRFGEMEVWALEGYGAAYMLREMLTIKSDDIVGRSATFDAIVKGEKIKEPNIPASFNVLLSELKGLALDVRLEKLADENSISQTI